MKPVLLILALGGIVAITSTRQDDGSCTDCGPAVSLPALESLPPRPAKFVPMSLPYPAPPATADWKPLAPAQRLADARARLLPQLPDEVAKAGAKLGSPAHIRVYKESRELELWLRPAGQWELFRTYPIAAMSGELGPKQKEGDRQAPEGFYSVNTTSLNPGSTFHLSFNIGYPNAYDRHHGRTGSFIMVHGDRVSIGCFAMTDPVIEELYLVVEAALKGGQGEVPVHVFPFRMTPDRMAEAAAHPAAEFWTELLPAYVAFENGRNVPEVQVRNGRYLVRP